MDASLCPREFHGPPRGDTWGGDNVKPRNVANGLEDPAWFAPAFPEFAGRDKLAITVETFGIAASDATLMKVRMRTV